MNNSVNHNTNVYSTFIVYVNIFNFVKTQTNFFLSTAIIIVDYML